MSALAPAPAPAPSVNSAELLVRDWLSAKSPATRRAYAGDLARFGRWLGCGPDAVGPALLGLGAAGARRLVLEYREELAADAKSPSTTNRALAALRSLVDLARDTGLVDWRLDVRGLRARSYRDTRGPAREDVEAILAAADSQDTPQLAARDGAMLRLLYGLALRRAELAALDVADLDDGRVWVRAKGCHDKAPLSVPRAVLEALAAWLAAHPDPRPDAPLFVRLDRAGAGERLTPHSVGRALKRACETAETRAYAPHALRHSAITAALDATGGDVRRVRAYSRHAKLETVATYDDHRRDGGGEVAELVAL